MWIWVSTTQAHIAHAAHAAAHPWLEGQEGMGIALLVEAANQVLAWLYALAAALKGQVRCIDLNSLREGGGQTSLSI
jgi:hypothetical protein